MNQSIQDTPLQAVVLQSAQTTIGTNDISVKTGVVTPTQGWQAVDLKPLLSHYYDSLHGEISYRLTPPDLAFKQGYILLNGSTLKKEDFRDWAKVVANGLATEIDEKEFQMKDVTNLYLRPAQTGIGTVQLESLPNITGYFGGSAGTFDGAFSSWPGNEVRSSGNASVGAGYTGVGWQRYFSASYSSSTYGRRNEVAPRSLLVHAYAFFGRYDGEPLEAKVYYLLNADKSFSGSTLTLLGEVGYNPSYMTPLPPPEMQKSDNNLAKPEKLVLCPSGWVSVIDN
jgi:hypothetical protein